MVGFTHRDEVHSLSRAHHAPVAIVPGAVHVDLPSYHDAPLVPAATQWLVV